MKLFSAAFILSFAACSSWAAVDPSLLALATPDARVLTGIQVSQSEASPFGQYILSQMKPALNFDQISAAIGFDPRRDLQEIMACSAGDVSGTPSGLILGRGTFQPGKIASAATAAGTATSMYKGFEILGNNGGGMVFLDGGTVAIGDLVSVHAVIDRRVAGTVYTGALADAAKAASAGNDAWFATATPAAFLAGKLPNSSGGAINPAQLLQSVLQTSGGVKFASSAVTLTLDAMTNNNQDAQSLADVVKFFSSMMQNGLAASPVNTATVTANGSVMHFSISLPEQQVEQLLMPPPSARAKKLAVR